ncbi:30S ribosomal protein S5 [Candidatus Falkowbacteria bacterium]|nr:MAG: 30S ribosomal protein S5 [Candidatus Falkowbacteria bacterium]
MVKKEAGNGPKKPVDEKAGKGGSVYAQKKRQERTRSRRPGRKGRPDSEFDQRIVDIARVTRVMAGGKRMRFRACVAIGNKKGKVAVGLDKGADVTMAVTKAVNKAKKNFIEVPIVNDTIPHSIYQKLGAAKILLKPARRGKGVIAGGAVRIVLDLTGIKNITSKILGTNNNVNVAKCTIAALNNLKKVELKEKKNLKNNDKPRKDRQSGNIQTEKNEKNKSKKDNS